MLGYINEHFYYFEKSSLCYYFFPRDAKAAIRPPAMGLAGLLGGASSRDARAAMRPPGGFGRGADDAGGGGREGLGGGAAW